MKLIFRLALLFTVPVFLYSLMAAGSSFSTMMMKNKDTLAASQLELQAANDQIGVAKAQVKEAQIGVNKGQLLQALYQTEVRNSRGVKVAFSDIRISCDSNGYYARNYPELCDQYQQARNGTLTASSVAQAETKALQTAASQKIAMAQIIKERPPKITPTLLGFALGVAAVGFIVSLALESAIIGVGFFEELFIKPTPLPAIVSFMNKALDWDANSITQRGLQVDIAPSPGAVNFASNGAMVSPFSTVGWSPSDPRRLDSAKTGAGERSAGDSAEGRTASDKARAPAQDVGAQDERAHKDEAEKSAQAQSERLDMEAIKERLLLASSAKIGEMFACVMCETETAKRTDTKRFCGKKCRDDFRKIARRGAGE